MSISPSEDTLHVAQKWRGSLKKEFFRYYFFYLCLKYLGLRVSYGFLAVIVFFFTLFNARGRKASCYYFRHLGKKDSPLKAWIRTYRHFYEFGQVLLDRTYITLVKKNPFLTLLYGNIDAYREHMESHPEGIIIMGAHAGNFEYAASTTRKFSRKVYLLMLKLHDEKLKAFLDSLHQKRSYEVIDLAEPVFAAQLSVQKLREGGVVCIMGDRDLMKKNTQAEFMGQKVKIPIGSFHIAALSEAPVFFTFCMRDKEMTYHLYFYGPYQIKGCKNASERLSKAAELAREYTGRLEEVVRKHPYQWFNFYDYWEEYS